MPHIPNIITLGRVVDAADLTQDPALILRDDTNGIAALRRRRVPNPDAHQELCAMSDDALKKLEGVDFFAVNGRIICQLNKLFRQESAVYNPALTTQNEQRADSLIGPYLKQLGKEWLYEFSQTYSLQQARASFWTRQAGLTEHVDNPVGGVTRHWQLKGEFGMTGYVGSGCHLAHIGHGYVDGGDLAQLIQSGQAQSFSVGENEEYDFNYNFVHNSGRRAVRLVGWGMKFS